ncbi:MAG: transcription elongation factor GreB [Deltaproteobacteria bacterium]|nr:transcription elongation factor GreB [Deltaproteobacteria bacterium]
MAGKRMITADGYRRHAEELEKLWRGERPKVVQEVADAAALGDRSENAEYIYGKKRLREIDKRIEYLSKLIDSFQIVDPLKMRSDRVRFGARVAVVDSEGAERSYQLVGADESEPKSGRISIESPVAKALLEKRVGDVVTVVRPAGDLELEIVAIRYE